MLRTELVDLINGGEAWAFVGSGASVGSGGLTWEGLLSAILDAAASDLRERIISDRTFEKARNGRNFARCFSVVESALGREGLESAVRASLAHIRQPGPLARLLADWPFRGYITTNFDHILERAVEDLRQRGWVPVGNSDDEVRKVSADPSEMVWHVHGSLEMRDGSRMILTEDDYDSIYLGDTPVSRQLNALLLQRRVVFFGFGFQDEEVKRVLRRVGQLSNPARPLFAVLPDLGGYENATELKDLRDNYNVDVIPYTTTAGSHDRLFELLDVYRSFTLRRSMRLTGKLPPPPSYDPETTSLLVYNHLCLGRSQPLPDEVLRTLVRARILSLLKFRSSTARSFLVADLEARTAALRGKVDSAHASSMLEQVIGELHRDGLVQSLPTGSDPSYLLTDSGLQLVNEEAATAERLRDQFGSSLKARAGELLTGDGAERVTAAATTFFLDSIEKRALGVAATVNAPFEQARSYNLVGLLRDLPGLMDTLTSEKEAVALSKVVQGVLSRPSEAERRYLGVALQAQFGVHLLGADPAALAARTRELASTAFLIDSTTLIPYLARSSVGYDGARLLIRLLKDVGSTVATTLLLCVEVAEHARWALANVGEGLMSLDGLRAASGRAGGRSNAFVDGLLEEVNLGMAQPDLLAYIRETCGCPPGATKCRDSDVQARLSSDGIAAESFEEFPGFDTDMLVSRDELSDKIAEKREERGSYRHERQVKAEAEALILVQGFRNRLIRVADGELTNGFFVSHTRVIDSVAEGGSAITIRPEAVLQWVTALMPCTPDELGSLVSLLLYELSEQGVEVVDQERLRTTFAPLISASRDGLEQELEKNRVGVTALYGEGAENAFRDVRSQDAPFVLQGWYAQQAQVLTEEVGKLTTRAEAAEAKARLTDEERRQLERFKLEKRERQRAERKRRAAAKSNPSKRRRRRGGT